jgi:hypothetical protein
MPDIPGTQPAAIPVTPAPPKRPRGHVWGCVAAVAAATILLVWSIHAWGGFVPAWLADVSPRAGGAVSGWVLKHTPIWFTGQGVVRYDPFLAPRLVVARGDEALPCLVWAWGRVDTTGRVGITDGIGSLGEDGAPAMGFLMVRLPVEDWSVRRAIAGALGAIGTRDALVHLVKLSFDPDARVAEAAARCMLAVPREQRYLVEGGLNAFIRKHHAALPPADLFRFWEEEVVLERYLGYTRGAMGRMVRRD